ncbi:MAG: ABC transporter substrate-binding protein [Vulcanibacillus sp.]
MKNLKPLLVLIILLNILTISITGCQNNSTTKDPNANQDEQPLIIRLAGGDYGEPSPFQHYPRGSGIYKMTLVFDSLLDKDENGLTPWLAESWIIDNNGKTYTFNIHENVKWHDGESLTAEDVKFSFEYFMKHPPISNSLLIDGKHFIESIEVVNNNQVKISVTEANATILESLGKTVIIPKHIWETVDDPNSFTGEASVIGSGPYVLDIYNKELGSYKFVANETFWGPQQNIDEIHFIPVSDETLAFEQNEIDLATISSDLLSRYEDNNEYKILRQPAFWGYRLIFNLEKVEEFNNKDIRQAVAYAINIDDIIAKVERGAAVPASAGYLPVDHVWYNDDVKQYNYDVEMAKQLLDNSIFSFELLVGNTTKEVRIAELIKLYLSEIGITVNINSVDPKTRDSAVKEGNYEVVIYGHGGWGFDADSLRTIYASDTYKDAVPTSSNIPGYYNEVITELGHEQLYTTDVNHRKDTIYQLQKVISEELPMLPLYNTTAYDIYRPAKYDGWMNMFDHHMITHSRLSYLSR